jgi:hypothetical protein
MSFMHIKWKFLYRQWATYRNSMKYDQHFHISYSVSPYLYPPHLMPQNWSHWVPVSQRQGCRPNAARKQAVRNTGWSHGKTPGVQGMMVRGRGPQTGPDLPVSHAGDSASLGAHPSGCWGCHYRCHEMLPVPVTQMSRDKNESTC